MRMNRYVVNSLELHLFFGRIMKEHAFFLRAGFTPAEPECGEKAEYYRKEFEDILCKAAELSDGIVSREVLSSGRSSRSLHPWRKSRPSALQAFPLTAR